MKTNLFLGLLLFSFGCGGNKSAGSPDSAGTKNLPSDLGRTEQAATPHSQPQPEANQETQKGGAKPDHGSDISNIRSPQKVNFQPNEVDTVFRNPDLGWVAYDFDPVLSPGNAAMNLMISSVYTNYFSWGDVEPFEGQYRWELIDRLLNAYPGHKIKIGITLLDPTSRPWCGATGNGQTPSWLSNRLFASGNGRWVTNIAGFQVPSTTKCGAGGAAVFEPHYWTTEFLKAHSDFVWSFARRYYDNSESVSKYQGAPDWAKRISTIDIATYGLWGEWHSDIAWPSDSVKRSTLNTMILNYHQAFSYYSQQTQKDAPFLEQSTVGSTLNAGNHIYNNLDPSQVRFSVETASTVYGTQSGMIRKFLGADPTLFFQEDEQKIVSNNISRAPLRLEWGSCSGAISQDAFSCLGGDSQTVDAAIDFALNLNASEIGWFKNVAEEGFPLSTRKDGSQLSILDYFQRNAGYRFFVSSFSYLDTVSVGQILKISQIWHQRGRGKLYRKHYLAAFLEHEGTSIPIGVSDSLDAHTWAVGPQSNRSIVSEFKIPENIAPGVHMLQFAVVDRYGEPAMNLAISGKATEDANKYSVYNIGKIVVL